MRRGDLVMRPDRAVQYGVLVGVGAERVIVVWADNKREYYVRHQWYRLQPVPPELVDTARKALVAKREAEQTRRTARLESKLEGK